MHRRRQQEGEFGPRTIDIIIGAPTLSTVPPEALPEAMVKEMARDQAEVTAFGEGGGALAGGIGNVAINQLTERIHDLERFRLSVESEIKALKENLDSMMKTVGSMDALRKSVFNLERQMQEIASLYDVLSVDINPFIDVRRLPSHESRGLDETFVTDLWIMKWMEFLKSRIPTIEIPNLLDYYKEIGWIDDTIESRIMSYLKSTMFENVPIDKFVTPEGEILPLDRDESDAWKLTLEDNMRSLMFIQRIKGRAIDLDVLRRVEEEAGRIGGIQTSFVEVLEEEESKKEDGDTTSSGR